MLKFASAGFLVAWLVVAQADVALAAGYSPSFRGQTLERVLPGEFERQDAILVSWDSDDAVMQSAVLQIVNSVWKRVNIIMLVSSPEGQIGATQALAQLQVPARAVRFVLVPFDSVWTRDYGPTSIILPDGTGELVDADYGHGDRIGDDSVPRAIAPLLGMTSARPPLNVDGGNLLSNGEGLCITTNALLDHNLDRGYRVQDVQELLRRYYGVREVVFLEPLAGEQTGHVDMFSAFVSADTVLVGEYSPDVDPLNAEILDRNAERLASLRTARGPLKVVRIPMPPHRLDVWRTYTNVLFANGTVVVPTYPGVDPQAEAQALAIYRHVLPGWTVVGLDCNRLIEWGGAVHCVTRNLCRLPAQVPAVDGGQPQLLGQAGGFVPPRIRGRQARPARQPRFDNEELATEEFDPELVPTPGDDEFGKGGRDEGSGIGEWQPTRRELTKTRPQSESEFDAQGAFPVAGARRLGHARFQRLPMFGARGDERFAPPRQRPFQLPARLESPHYFE